MTPRGKGEEKKREGRGKKKGMLTPHRVEG